METQKTVTVPASPKTDAATAATAEKVELDLHTCLHHGTTEWWAMPYDPTQPSPIFSGIGLNNTDGAVGFANKTLVLDGLTAERLRKDKEFRRSARTFTRCWLTGKMTDLNLSNWEFVQCCFDGSVWEKVKFSNCKFRSCHFSKVEFKQCAFLETCTFEKNSASAELLHMDNTMIDATAFLQGVTTNLDHVPAGVVPNYQTHRLIKTKENIAMLVFNSTRNEANLAYYFRAYKEVVLAELNARIEGRRYRKDKKSQKWVLRNSVAFGLLTSLTRFERAIVKTSGRLTDWGQSLTPACLTLLAIIILFSIVYRLTGWIDPLPTDDGLNNAIRAALKATNITLVAGFDYAESGSIPQQTFEFINLFAGIFWYSLVVAVVSRKVLR